MPPWWRTRDYHSLGLESGQLDGRTTNSHSLNTPTRHGFTSLNRYYKVGHCILLVGPTPTDDSISNFLSYNTVHTDQIYLNCTAQESEEDRRIEAMDLLYFFS